MSKEAFLAKFQSAGNQTPVAPIEGLPKLFMRKLSHGEYSQCLAARERLSGEKFVTIDYAAACIVACVDEAGKPYFTKDDLAGLQLLDQVGIGPFVEAFNTANGIGETPKDSGPSATATEA